MTVGLLGDIIERIRIVSATGRSSQLTDEKIIKYINAYYINDFPSDLRILKLKDIYTFNTIQGVDVYPFDFDNWMGVSAPAFIAKIQVPLFQDWNSFYGRNFNASTSEIFDYGDGTVGPYSGSTVGSPMRRSVYNNPMVVTQTAPTGVSPAGYPPNFGNPNITRIQNILISANTASSTLHVTDDGAGNLIGNCTSGTIDYLTGVITNLSFSVSVPTDNEIRVQYIKTTFGKPTAILFQHNQFVLSAVPDQAYAVEMEAFRQPSKALLGTTSTTAFNESGRPEEFSWWELIVYGVSKKLYQERLDMEGVQMMQVFIEEQLSNIRSKTYGQLGSRQIPTMYRDALNQLNFEG